MFRSILNLLSFPVLATSKLSTLEGTGHVRLAPRFGNLPKQGFFMGHFFFVKSLRSVGSWKGTAADAVPVEWFSESR